MKRLILVELILLGILSLLLYATTNLETAISFVTASLLGLYSWNKITQNVVRKLQQSGAISPETAVKPEKAGITWESLWLELVAERTKEGCYYLAERRTDKIIIFMMIAAIAITAAGMTLNVNPFLLIFSWVVAIIIWRVVTEKIAEKTR
jgi:hypothetical protein